MAILFSARTDVGKVREQNEDNFLVDRKLQLYVVCDGMGGHLSGEVASATAVNVVRETLLQHQALLDGFSRRDGTVTGDDVRALLTEAVQEASFRIHERGQLNPGQRGMGTTLSLLLLSGNRGFIAHVGDSRVYRWRDGVAEQLTEDHSLYNAMKRGGANLDGIEVTGRMKNAVTRAVGVHESVEVDTLEFQLASGDRFMLCSDGLHGYFEAAELGSVLGGDIDQSVERLISQSNARGGKDNITAILLELLPGDELAAAGTPAADDALAASPLARGLDEGEREQLRQQMEEIACPPGENLVRAGAAADAAWVVLEGALVVVGDGTRVVRIGPGELVGAVLLLTGQPHPAAIKAVGEVSTRLLRLGRETLARLAMEQPQLAVRLTLNLARTLAVGLVDASLATGEVLWRYGAPIGPVTRPHRRRPRPATNTMDLDPSEIIEAESGPGPQRGPASQPPLPPPDPPVALRRHDPVDGRTRPDADDELGFDRDNEITPVSVSSDEMGGDPLRSGVLSGESD